MSGTPRPQPALGARAVALAAELVRTDSVNPGLVPGAAGEGAVVGLLERRLRSAGLTTLVVEASEPARPSLLAWGPHRGRGPCVALTGHLDTVGVEGMADPFGGRVHGGRLTGRGACDMKAGVAAMVVAAEELVARGAPGQVVLALVADEEDRSLGAEAVIAALPGAGLAPDVVVVGEPTWLAQAASLRGYALVEVTFTGRAAHSSQPAEGVNAVTHLGRLLAAVEDRAGTVEARGGALMVTVAHGGRAPFTLADAATAVIERRTVAGEPAACLVAEVADILTGLGATDPTVDASARLLIARDPWRLQDDGPAADLAGRIEATLGGVAPRLDAPYWMEAPLWESAGIPALVCGPAGGGLHSVDEWCDVAQVEAYAVGLVEVLSGADRTRARTR